MKIGIFGGSFDPVHKGHLEIAKYAINELNLDKLIFVPAYSSPFKTTKKTASGEYRIKMIQLATDGEDKIEVSDFEVKRGGVSYTIDTLKYFKNKYKNDQLLLLIGSDNLMSLNKWKNIDEICKLAKIVVFKRSNNFNKIYAKKYNALILNNPIRPESSTLYKKGELNFVPEVVADYIAEHRLYIEQIIFNTLTALRAKHSTSCAEFAVALAKAHGLSARDAYFAGLVHDIAKEIDPEVSMQIIKENEPELLDSFENHMLHQYTGYLILKHALRIKNEDILNAVKYHTSMRENMTPLDIVVYIADKICQGRKYPGIQKVRALALKDLKAGFSQAVQDAYDYNINKGVVFSDKQLALYNKYRSGKSPLDIDLKEGN